MKQKKKMSNSYLELKLSWELFARAPEILSEPERSRLATIATKQNRIEQCILASAEAVNVVVPDATLMMRLEEIGQRYPNDEEFAQDMQRIGLNKEALGKAVERDLRVEAVLEKVASEAMPVNPVDAEIYYLLHPEAFNRPEVRRLRHILITCNNSKEKAKALVQLEALRSSLKDAEKFAEAALRYSQCPTALEGGQLGVVKRGQLYPELEPAAFALSEGEISHVLESPIGQHIVRCDEISPGGSGMLPFTEVQEKIINYLFDMRCKKMQKDWIKSRLSNKEKERQPNVSEI